MIETPLTLPCGLTLENRIAKAAMTEALADDEGRPTEAHQRLYRRFANGGAGLVITGNVMIDGRFLERSGNVIVEDEAVLPGLTAWAKAVGASSSRLIAQLSHPGRQVQRFISTEPVAPSAVPAVQYMKSFAPPRALGDSEIEELVRRFARAAAWFHEAGFGGVQIHSAHGYLISQFLSPLTNRRDDRWGGTLENRARFLLQIVRAVRAATPRSFLVSVKLNSADFQRGGFAEDDSLEVIAMLEPEGVDLLEISGGNYESPKMFTGADPRRESTRKREAFFLAFAERVRAVTRLPIMVTGGFRSRAAMVEALRSNALDVVGLARPLALEPDLPKRLIDGSAERSLATPKRFLTRRLDILADGAWSWMQLRRMGEGLDPSPDLGVTRAVLAFVVGDFLRARRRRRLLASQPARPQLPKTAAQ